MRLSALALPLFFSLLACQLSFASVQWSYSAHGAIIGKPILLSDKAIFSTHEGNVYGFASARGSISWMYDAGGSLAAPVAQVSSDTLAVATVAGRLSFISSLGKEGAVASLPSAPRYLAGGSGTLYASFKDGVRAYSQSGKSLWNFTLASPAGPLSSYGNSVYFTSGGKLYSLAAKDGSQNWAVPAEDSFQSAPLAQGGGLYFGATDGRLYSYDAVSGRQRWSFQTGGWVQSTPVRSGDSIFFGSNDGNLYSVTDSGKLRFSYKSGEGVWGEPVLYESSGRQLAVFGSNDGNVYALDAGTGEAVWSFSAGGRLGGISEKNGVFYFGTSNGMFYSLSPSPICSISWPQNGGAVGDWPVAVEGTAYSDLGLQMVEVRLEGGNWQPAAGTYMWRADIDFTSQPYGAFRVECRASDASGGQQSGDYSYTTLVKTQNVPLQKMSVVAPSEAAKNATITISARDSRGSELSGVALSVAGEKKTGDSPFAVVLGRSGAVQVALEKPGFEPVSFIIVGTGGDSLLLPIIALIVLAGLAFFAYRKFFRKVA